MKSSTTTSAKFGNQPFEAEPGQYPGEELENKTMKRNSIPSVPRYAINSLRKRVSHLLCAIAILTQSFLGLRADPPVKWHPAIKPNLGDGITPRTPDQGRPAVAVLSGNPYPTDGGGNELTRQTVKFSETKS